MKIVRKFFQAMGLLPQDEVREEALQPSKAEPVLLSDEKLDELVGLLQLDNDTIAHQAEDELRRASIHQADAIMQRLLPVCDSINTQMTFGFLGPKDFLPSIAENCSEEFVPTLLECALEQKRSRRSPLLFDVSGASAIKKAISLLAEKILSSQDEKIRSRALKLLRGPNDGRHLISLRGETLRSPEKRSEWAEHHVLAQDALGQMLESSCDSDVIGALAVIERGMPTALETFGNRVDVLAHSASLSIAVAACRTQLLIQDNLQRVLTQATAQLEHADLGIRHQALRLLGMLAYNERADEDAACDVLTGALFVPELSDCAAAVLDDVAFEISANHAEALLDLVHTIEARKEDDSERDDNFISSWRFERLLSHLEYDVSSVESMELLIRLMRAEGVSTFLSVVSKEKQFPVIVALKVLQESDPRVVLDTLERGHAEDRLKNFFPILFKLSAKLSFKPYRLQSNRRGAPRGTWQSSDVANLTQEVLLQLAEDARTIEHASKFADTGDHRERSNARALFLSAPIPRIKQEIRARMPALLDTENGADARRADMDFVAAMLLALEANIIEFSIEVQRLYELNSRSAELIYAELVKHDGELRAKLAKSDSSANSKSA